MKCIDEAGAGSPVSLLLRMTFSRPGRALAAAALGLVAGVLSWALAFLVKVVLDHTSEARLLTGVGVAIAGAIVLRAGLAVARRAIQLALVRTIEEEIATRYLEQVLRLETNSFRRNPPGELLARLQGLDHLRHALEDRVLGVFFDALLVLAAGGMLACYSPGLAGLAFLGALIPAVIVFLIKGRIKHSFADQESLQARVASGVTDALQGFQDLRTTGGGDWILGRLKEGHRSVLLGRCRHHFRLGLIGGVTGVLSALMGVLILLVGASEVRTGRLTPGDLMFAFTLSQTMLGPLESLAISWLFFQDAAGAVARCGEIVNLPGEERRTSLGPEVTHGEIVLDRVRFSYPGAEDVLQDLSLRIPGGTTLAIVGPSGAGKSTLLSLLARLQKPGGGRITVDGSEIESRDPSFWRTQVGVVLQDPHLFRATIRENLRLGCPEADEDRLRVALEEAGALPFVSRLPGGLDTLLSGDGSPLSGGEAQRIAIARAVVKGPRILLLDEATSNVDPETELAIWNSLERGKGRRTTVFVTHRLASSLRADQVVVLDGGRIVEHGAPDELLRRTGRFHGLWVRQNPLSGIAPTSVPQPELAT